MPALYTLSTSLLLLTTHAQWPTSPNAPLVICNDPSDQRFIGFLPDGSDGWIALWTDDRVTALRYSIYGQRIDPQGNLLWEPNGRLLQEVPGRSINFVGANRMSNGNLLLAYACGANHQTADTLRAMAIDVDGAPVWDEPTLLAQPGLLPGGGTANGHYYPRVTPVLEGVFVGWGTNPIGAADYVHVARILNDGTNLMPVQGVEVTSLNNSIVTGPWSMRHDLAGGLLFEERWGNGAGAPLYAMRVNEMGTQLWPNLLQVSANSNGLGYEWSSALAPNARMNSVWGYGYDLRMAVYDTTGVLLNTNAPIDVCMQAEVQENPFVVQSASESTVFWADNRSSAGNGRQVFMQRFAADGTPVLAADGVLAMQCDGNLNGFPRAIVAEDESHIVSMFTGANLSGGTAGFRVGRVTNTGTNLWSDTTRFCIPTLGPNGGTAYGLASDGDGGAMSIWFNWENNAIYAARLDRWGRMGDFTGVAEHERSNLSLFPNPAKDRITLQNRGGNALGEVRIHAADGRVVMEPDRIATERTEIDVQALPAGLYTVISQGPEGQSAMRFVKE